MPGSFLDRAAFAINPYRRRNLDQQAQRLSVVSHAHRYVYTMNYRVGSTSFRRALIELELTGRVGDPAFTPPSADVRDVFAFNASVRTVRRLVTDEGYFHFSMVRHPLTRLVSAYEGKLALNRRQAAPIKAWLRRRGIEVGDVVGFDQFVHYLERAGDRGVNNHWRPQHLMLMCAHFDYDHLGRFEAFDESFRLIFERLGAPVVSVPHRNPAPAATVAAQALSADMRRRIFKLYRKDFEKFGYELAV